MYKPINGAAAASSFKRKSPPKSPKRKTSPVDVKKQKRDPKSEYEFKKAECEARVIRRLTSTVPKEFKEAIDEFDAHFSTELDGLSTFWISEVYKDGGAESNNIFKYLRATEDLMFEYIDLDINPPEGIIDDFFSIVTKTVTNGEDLIEKIQNDPDRTLTEADRKFECHEIRKTQRDIIHYIRELLWKKIPQAPFFSRFSQKAKAILKHYEDWSKNWTEEYVDTKEHFSMSEKDLKMMREEKMEKIRIKTWMHKVGGDTQTTYRRELSPIMYEPSPF